MTMTFGDLLEMVRQDYVDNLLATADDLKAEGAEVVFEPPFKDPETGELQLEGALKLPARVDLAVRRGAVVEPMQVVAEGVFNYDDAINVSWEGGMKVQVYPFGWEAMPLVLEGVDLKLMADWLPMQQWFWRWFAEPEELDTPVQEVVHHLSEPKVAGKNVSFLADLGTAPLEAWQDLLDACAACGATKVTVGNRQKAE